jgi:hypothetical protein
MRDKLLSLEWWTGGSCALAVLGVVLILVGRALSAHALVHAGIWFCAPLLALACVLLVIGIPYVVLRRRR